jgi:hypothetical protein
LTRCRMILQEPNKQLVLGIKQATQRMFWFNQCLKCSNQKVMKHFKISNILKKNDHTILIWRIVIEINFIQFLPLILLDKIKRYHHRKVMSRPQHTETFHSHNSFKALLSTSHHLKQDNLNPKVNSCSTKPSNIHMSKVKFPNKKGLSLMIDTLAFKAVVAIKSISKKVNSLKCTTQ